jgi:hypothetical protein
VIVDYTYILPADAQRVLSSCGRYGHQHDQPYDEAAIVIGDGVRLRVRTLYGSDGVPMNEWHGLVLAYPLPPDTDAEWLREALAEGGELAVLIDRLVAGHETLWNGSNYVGRLNADALEAGEALSFALQDVPKSPMELWDAEEWLHGVGTSPEDIIAELRLTTPEQMLAEAESDGTIIIAGGLDGMREAYRKILT